MAVQDSRLQSSKCLVTMVVSGLSGLHQSIKLTFSLLELQLDQPVTGPNGDLGLGQLTCGHQSCSLMKKVFLFDIGWVKLRMSVRLWVQIFRIQGILNICKLLQIRDEYNQFSKQKVQRKTEKELMSFFLSVIAYFEMYTKDFIKKSIVIMHYPFKIFFVTTN